MWVIIALSLVAMAMLVLAEGANTLLFQADTAHGQAVERNLTASALAWAQTQVARGTAPENGNLIALDSTQVGDQHAHLTVEFVRLDDATADILIQNDCTKGRQTFSQSTRYAIDRP